MAFTATESAFHAALGAPDGPTEIPHNSRLYGWLVGSWEGDVFDYGRPKRFTNPAHSYH
jgi:hypothetical protein